MKRRQQLYAKLDNAEAELRAVLLPALEEVAAGRDTMLFITKYNNPWPELRNGSAAGNKIVQRARVIVTLAQQLGADTSDLLASKVLASFEAANDLKNANRVGPIRLAQQLLAEMSLGT